MARSAQAERIRKSLADLGKEGPYIAFIGATCPGEDYDAGLTMLTASLLRKDIKNGTIFTGGVGGVGLDVQLGIVMRCMMEKEKTGTEQQDKFFILIPTKHFVSFEQSGEVISSLEPYEPPKGYNTLAKAVGRKEVFAVRAGTDMEQRRNLLAEVADVCIVCNGGYGTLHEAILALNAGARVIALRGTGGAAEKIAIANTHGDWTFQVVKCFEKEAFTLPDPSLALVAETPAEAVEMALKALK